METKMYETFTLFIMIQDRVSSLLYIIVLNQFMSCLIKLTCLFNKSLKYLKTRQGRPR